MGKVHFDYKILLVLMVCAISFFVNNKVIVPDIMESRNMVTAREMVYDGNWLVPTMNGEIRLEKPPLPTWISALVEIASPDDLGMQRAMAGVAATMLVIFFFLIAKEISDNNDFPLISSLILCTCYNMILLGRTASWDIYCHAFMLGAIYFLIKAFKTKQAGNYFIAAGVFMGLSCMSKGPVSFYALLLPFLISYLICFRTSMSGKWKWIMPMIVICITVGCWWYSFITIFHNDEMGYVASKEVGSWLNRSVRPWFYYWKFFLETGIWSVLLLSALFLPFWSGKSRSDKSFLFPYLWMFLTLILLSLLPEKKSRYLLPILISASYVCGYIIVYWNARLRSSNDDNLDTIIYRINAWIIAIVVILLPAVGYLFVYSKGYISLPVFMLICLAIETIGYMLVKAAVGLRPIRLVLWVTLFFIVIELFVLPFMVKVINNPDIMSIARTKKIEDIRNIPFYYNSKDGVRIEIVYAAGKKIRPLDLNSEDSIMSHLPLVLLTHKRVAEEVDSTIFEKVDTVTIGKFDDNRWSKEDKRYKDYFVYNVTLLKER